MCQRNGFDFVGNVVENRRAEVQAEVCPVFVLILAVLVGVHLVLSQNPVEIGQALSWLKVVAISDEWFCRPLKQYFIEECQLIYIGVSPAVLHPLVLVSADCLELTIV